MDEYTKEFAIIAEKKEITMESMRQIQDIVTQILKNKCYEQLLSLEDSFKDMDILDTAYLRKLKCIIIGTRLEKMNEIPLFCENAVDVNGLMELYTLSIFALRRLEMGLSRDSIEQAEGLLRSIRLSAYMVAVLLENEYFENKIRVCNRLKIFMRDIWTDKETYFLLQQEELK